MKTYLNPETLQFQNRTLARLPKHDLVYGSPLNDASASLPLGDGDTGSLLWFGEDALHIILNKSDLWDDGSNTSEVFCSGETEDLTCRRHGGEVTVRFPMPCFDMIYQKNFDARISLADATVRIDAETPFSHVKGEMFASAKAKTTMLRLKCAAEDPAAMEISLARWGSRNFWRWYAMNNGKPEAGLNDTEAESKENRIYIHQKLKGTIFCVGLALVSENQAKASVKNRHEGILVTESVNEQELTLFWNISLGKDAGEAKEKCEKALDQAIEDGFDALHAAHAAEWAEFWNRSYFAISDDYIENIGYLYLYYANSACRGAYAPHFTQGIWGFNHDFLPWTYYFHYNMQHFYPPLQSTGHGELCENYFRMRREHLSYYYRYAKEVKHQKGAFCHDVVDRFGRGADYDSDNATPLSQIAMAMWQHYRMWGDKEFLENAALPMMRGAAEYYLSILEKGEDGLYHTEGTSAYEGTPPFKDTITDKVMIKALFGVMQELTEGEEKAKYQDVLNHLPDYLIVPMEEAEVQDGKLVYGMGAGKEALANHQVLAVGIAADGKPIRKNYAEPNSPKNYYGFPDTEMSPIYPAGMFGLADKGSELFDIMTNQVRLHRWADGCMHWCMMPIYLARMGMADELAEYMPKTASAWLTFPNGFAADGGTERDCIRDRFIYHKPMLLGTPYRGMIEGYRFRHFEMETMPILTNAVCESILQSYDGILRICPAVRKNDPVGFRLYAEGGFRVEGEIGEENYVITIESMRGEACYVKLPEVFGSAPLYVYKKEANGSLTEVQPEVVKKGVEEVVDLTKLLGSGQVIALSNVPRSEWEMSVPVVEKANEMMKSCGNSMLGTPPLVHHGRMEKES